jgi:hypothetical protein
MTNIVYKRLPTRYGAILNDDKSAAYGSYDIVVPEQYIDPSTGDLLPWVEKAWEPVLNRMRAERDKVVGDYLAMVEPDKTILKQLRKKDAEEQVDYIRSKSKDKYDDLLDRFRAIDKTKTLIIPADVSAWSRWYFDTKAPDNDNELTKWAEEKIKESWPTGVMRYSPTVQLLGKHGIRYPAGANLGDFAGRAGIDLMSIPIDTPLGMVSLYNSLKSNARDTLTQFPAAVLNTLQDKYGGLDKIVTSFSESPVNTFIDILCALSLAKGIGKAASYTAAAISPQRVKQLIPLAEEAAKKGRAVTSPVLKEVSRQKYDAIRRNEINALTKLEKLQNTLDELKQDAEKSYGLSNIDDIIAIDKKLDMLQNDVDTIGNKLVAKRQTYPVELDTYQPFDAVKKEVKELLPYPPKRQNVPIEKKITELSSKLDDMIQQAKKIAEESNARIGGDVNDLADLTQLYAGKREYIPSPGANRFTLADYASDSKTLQDTIDATMRWPSIDPIVVKGTALQPQYEMMLPSIQGTAPKAVRMGMTDRIDTIIGELLDVQDKQRRTKSKSELKQLENRLNELEKQLQKELGGYLYP